MKEITLTQGQIALVDDEDYEYLNQFKWHAYKKKNTYTFYAYRSTLLREGSKRTVVAMHRQILGLTNSKQCIDHKDQNGLNNQRLNIRLATVSQNGANRNSGKNSKSKYLGVSWNNSCKRWAAFICKNKNPEYLGVFKTEEEAALTYNKRAIELQGEFASLNKITA